MNASFAVKHSGPRAAKVQGAGKSTLSNLRINEPNDAFEQEAERVADEVMNGGRSDLEWLSPQIGARRFVQRKCSCGQGSGEEPCAECKKEAALQRKSNGTAGPALAPSIVHQVLGSTGQALDPTTRVFMEPRLSHDFSQVRIHSDAKAAESARAVNALAYTVGNHIVFGAGSLDLAGQAGRRLLAHELVHVTQQQTGKGPSVQRQGGPVQVGLPEPEECEGRAEITNEFNDFLKALPALLQSAPDFTPEQRVSFKAEFDRFLQSEGGVNVKNFKIISCDKINSDLLVGRETASAEVDPNKKEIRLSKNTAKLMDDFKQNKDKASLATLIETLAHEKRHVTLGAALKVDPKNVLPGRPETVAAKAEYRAQEILATAEEIAVGRMAFGKSFAVPQSKQEKLRRQNNMIRNYVTEAEYKRLRSIIISKLRERYGFDHGCDNALTLGVISSMDHNRWFECVSGAPGGIVPPVPDDLHICEGFCEKKSKAPGTSENEEDVPLQRKDNGTTGLTVAPPIVHQVLSSPGQPLDAQTHDFMQPRFGHDFGHVRVHTDAIAAESARAVKALAYTVGQHIVFDENQYRPTDQAGQKLLAHELTHTIQQPNSRSPAGSEIPLDDNNSESEATVAAERIGSQRISVRHGSAKLAKQPKPMDPRHARGYGGEQSMGFGYSQEKGWIFVEGPGGAAGHGVTTKGFDGVAYNIQADELHLIDNKSLKAETASSATALTRNLQRNLDTLIQKVSGMRDMPNRIRILELLKKMRAAIAGGNKLPGNTKLIVTGEGGQAKAVSTTLAKQGVEFREPGTTDMAAAAQTPPTAPQAKASLTPSSEPAAKQPTTTGTPEPAPAPAQTQPTVPETIPPEPAPPVKVQTPPAAPAPKTAPSEPIPPVEPPATIPRVPTTSPLKGGLKAGGKAAAFMILFMALEYYVHKKLQENLEKEIDSYRPHMQKWAERKKKDSPDQPVYMRLVVRSEEYSRYIPVTGWVPEPPVLMVASVGVTNTPIDPPEVKVEDHSLDILRPGKTTEVTYTELLID